MVDGDPIYYQSFTKGLTKADPAMLANLGLQALDGRAAVLRSSEVVDLGLDQSLPEGFERFLYDLGEGCDHGEGSAYHTLQVQMEPARLKARIGAGYYAQP